MKIASIVPIPYLRLIDGKEYHLCLAHLALYSPEYKEFYRQQAAKGSYVILDNGAAEGETVNSSKLVQLAREIGARELILPDYIGDAHRTLDESYKMLHYIKARGDFGGKVMAVPQGLTLKEWIAVATEMMNWPIDVIGIPKFLTYAFGPYGRLLALRALPAPSISIEYHLLGCAYDPREVAAIEKLFPHLVRGVDSSLPYLYARDGYELYLALKEGIARSQLSIDFTESETRESLIVANIQVWERMCNGELL